MYHFDVRFLGLVLHWCCEPIHIGFCRSQTG